MTDFRVFALGIRLSLLFFSGNESKAFKKKNRGRGRALTEIKIGSDSHLICKSESKKF